MPHERRRTIRWTTIWNKERQGVGLEHLLLEERAAGQDGGEKVGNFLGEVFAKCQAR